MVAIRAPNRSNVLFGIRGYKFKIRVRVYYGHTVRRITRSDSINEDIVNSANYRNSIVIPIRNKQFRIIRGKLFETREGRVHPFKDDKILTDWNGLMISALAKGSNVLDDQGLEDAAIKAAKFILNEMKTKEGKLLHIYREGDAFERRRSP